MRLTSRLCANDKLRRKACHWRSIHLIVRAHLYWDDLMILNQQLKRDAIGQIDRNRMQFLQSAR